MSNAYTHTHKTGTLEESLNTTMHYNSSHPQCYQSSPPQKLWQQFLDIQKLNCNVR